MISTPSSSSGSVVFAHQATWTPGEKRRAVRTRCEVGVCLRIKGCSALPPKLSRRTPRRWQTSHPASLHSASPVRRQNGAASGDSSMRCSPACSVASTMPLNTKARYTADRLRCRPRSRCRALVRRSRQLIPSPSTIHRPCERCKRGLVTDLNALLVGHAGHEVPWPPDAFWALIKWGCGRSCRALRLRATPLRPRHRWCCGAR